MSLTGAVRAEVLTLWTGRTIAADSQLSVSTTPKMAAMHSIKADMAARMASIYHSLHVWRATSLQQQAAALAFIYK